MADAKLVYEVELQAKVEAAAKVLNAQRQMREEASRLADEMEDVERAMSGTWGQRGTQDLGVFVDYAKQAGSATDSASSSIGRFGEVLNQVGGKGAAANDILEGLSNTFKGNERSALGAAKGIGSLIALIGTGGATLGLSAIALGVAALISFITKTKEAREAQEALAKSAKEAVARMAELGSTPMEKLLTNLEEADRAASSFLSTQLKLLETQGKIADQEAANARARIEQSNMSEREKATAIARIAEQEAIRKAVEPAQRANLELLAAGNAETDKRRALEEAQRVATESGAQAEFERYTKAIEQFGELKKLRAELSKSYSESALAADNPFADDSANIARRKELLARERALKKSTAGYGSESNYTEEGLKQKEDAAKTAQYPVTQAQQALAEAEKRTTAALDKYQQEVEAAAALKKSQKEGRDLDTQKTAKEATEKDRATEEDRKKAQAELDKIKADTEAAAQARMAGGGAYEYTYDERAAIAEKQQALDKMGPATPAAPTAPAKPVKTTTYAPRTSAEKAGQQPGAAAPTAQGPAGQLPDLATPLRDAAQKAGDSATQSADSIQAAADAAKAVADNTKPLDASALTAALQSAATAQQTASTQTATGIQQMVSLAEQQTALAREQATKIATMTTQINSLRVEVGQLRAQVRAA